MADIVIERATVAEGECDHGVVFDVERWKRDLPSGRTVRALWPRLHGKCPKGCGFEGIAYASFTHYLAGDW